MHVRNPKLLLIFWMNAICLVEELELRLKGKDPKLEPLLRTHRSLRRSLRNTYIGLESRYVTWGDF